MVTKRPRQIQLHTIFRTAGVSEVKKLRLSVRKSIHRSQITEANKNRSRPLLPGMAQNNNASDKYGSNPKITIFTPDFLFHIPKIGKYKQQLQNTPAIKYFRG